VADLRLLSAVGKAAEGTSFTGIETAKELIHIIF